MINFKIISEKELIIMCFLGDITPDDIIGFIDSLILEEGYNIKFRVLIDVSRVNFSYDVQGLRRVMHYMMTKDGFAGERKSAFIALNANQVVPPMIMKAGTYDFPMKIRVVATIEAALNWLEIEGFSVGECKKLLDEIC